MDANDRRKQEAKDADEAWDALTPDGLRELARELYQDDHGDRAVIIDDDAEIDDSPEIGAWVTARVWVSKIDALDAAEEAEDE